MIEFDTNKSFSDYLCTEELKGIGPYLSYSLRSDTDGHAERPLSELCGIFRHCSPKAILAGLSRVIEAGVEGRLTYPLYAPEECTEENRKKHVLVFHFPVKEVSPALIICSGGAYRSVCNVVEGFVAAEHFNRLGYNVFVLNYRVGVAPVLPEVTEDLARCVSFISSHRKAFHLSDGYLLSGFSAGSHVITNWCVDGQGYSALGYEKPLALFPIYPAIAGKEMYTDPALSFFLDLMLKTPTPEALDALNAEKHCSGFPPCYLVVGKDDGLIDPAQITRFANVLNAHGIPAIAEIAPSGPHGFGDGTDTGAEGWPERADAFFKELTK